ncbi:hypothetical protein FHS82_004151 [Pseudochelatococcus lubricantis]|uniref:Uncharacterized protein n=1 Tax=Pseudochelatococcus lubricantis TaxID=1538102 RepID=A0ABX0V4Z0_9HYPH|nr:hypothetical protein [Pseudochelatococcus lubricantis]
MCTGVEPRESTPHLLDTELPLLNIKAIDIGNFKFSTCGWLEVRCNINNLFIIEIKDL